MAAPAISIRNLDHLGLVAALCQELGIARMIDALLPKTPPFKVSHGEALVAMIVNGLGFHSSTLHMFPQFFANKPVERLIGPGICADDLNDDVLGRCLDALFEADVSALYQVMAALLSSGWGSKAPQCTSILPASTSMAPMTVPMGIWSVSCNWCVVIVVITGQS